MSEFTDALMVYEQAIAQRGGALRDYIRPGLEDSEVRGALQSAGIPTHVAVVEWFEFCGGLQPAPSGSTTILQGRRYLSLQESLAQRSTEIDDDYPITYAQSLPLTSDHPVVVVDVSTGSVRELDAEQGWIDLGDSPAAWIRSQIEALGPVGPHPRAQRVVGFAGETGQPTITRASFHVLDQVIPNIRGLDIAEMWITTAHPGSKHDNGGQETAQVRAAIDWLIAGGVSPHGEVQVVESAQRPEPPHRMELWVRLTE